MMSKKPIAVILVMVMALTACSMNKGEKVNVPSQQSHTINSTISDEKKNESKNQADTGNISMNSSNTETAVDNQVISSNNVADKPVSKPSQRPAQPSSKPTGSSANKPSKPNNHSSSANKPSGGNSSHSSSKPIPHTHKWEKQPPKKVFEWENSCGPDENGYTSNRDIAINKNGKKIGIYMCARCYKYFGGPDNDEWFNRYWDHIEQPGPCKGVGYCAYNVYAVFDAFHCKECDAWKRGNIAFYGYYDYSNGVKWIYLEPWQIKELNLEMP